MAEENESASQMLARLKAEQESRAQKQEELKKKQESCRWGSIKKKIMEAVAIGGIVAAIATVPAYYLARDYLTKRQDYPKRDVLYSCMTNIDIKGAKSSDTQKPDMSVVTSFYRGSGAESNVGTFLFETGRIYGEKDTYYMNNPQNIRIASASQIPERVQAGIRTRGSLLYREQFAEVFRNQETRPSENYTVYKFAPERGFKEKDIDVIEHLVNDHGTTETVREMVNRLVESRNLFGWLKGKEKYRAGTQIEDYEKTPENSELEKKFLLTIGKLHSSLSTNPKDRERIMNEAMSIEEQMERKPVYTTFEDGFLKVLLPPESTVFLGYSPSSAERMKNWLGFGRHEHARLRVENHLSMIPGNWPLLKHLGWLFNKYNNGGYTIEDKFGKFAGIKIVDFALFYGQDTRYNYYLDLNGDGKLDENELTGKVLFEITPEGRSVLEKMAWGTRPETDVKLKLYTYFMAPDDDLKEGFDCFKLGAYTETIMPDQVHRGNGQYSYLGFINDFRSDIMLFEEPNKENMSRALTQESTLCARHDIPKLLIAVKRPYARELAESYGLGKEFEGKYETSNLLREKLVFSPLPGVGLLLAGGAGAYLCIRNKRRKAREKREQNKPLVSGEK